MSADATTRVAHPFRLYRKGWVIAQCATVFIAMGISNQTASAQSTSCGLTTMRNAPDFEYPRLASAAHITGSVVLLVTFAHDGTASQVKILQGIGMLRDAGLILGKGLVANSSDGSRECPIVARFVIDIHSDFDNNCQDRNPTQLSITWEDSQHVTIHGKDGMTCDPSMTITRLRYHFLFFHWYSKPIPQ